MSMFNNRRRHGGNWLLYLAGMAGVYVLGREVGKHNKMQANSGSSWNQSSTSHETVNTPESGHQI